MYGQPPSGYGQAPPQQQPQYSGYQQQQPQYGAPQQGGYATSPQQTQMSGHGYPATAGYGQPQQQQQQQQQSAVATAVIEQQQAGSTAGKAGPIVIDTQHDDMVHDAQLDYYGTKLATSSSGT